MKIKWNDINGVEFEIDVPSGELSYSINQGGEIGYDYHGRVSRVGNNNIGYDYQGRVSIVGNNNIGYDYQGRVSKIGYLEIKYDYNGRFSGTSGYIN
jgi:hypothetical protein